MNSIIQNAVHISSVRMQSYISIPFDQIVNGEQSGNIRDSKGRFTRGFAAKVLLYAQH